jgi:hypothetical protein
MAGHVPCGHTGTASVAPGGHVHAGGRDGHRQRLGPSARHSRAGALHVYLQAPNYVSNLLRLGFTEDDIRHTSDRLVDALVAWGDETAIVRRVTEHHAAGADHVCVQVVTGEPALPRAEWRALAAAFI